jgi:hypothetical protein
MAVGMLVWNLVLRDQGHLDQVLVAQNVQYILESVMTQQITIFVEFQWTMLLINVLHIVLLGNLFSVRMESSVSLMCTHVMQKI